MSAEYVRETKSDSSARLWALEPKVRQLAESDPDFEKDLLNDPLTTLRARFGEAAMPNEGEFVRATPDGRELVFPKSNAAWKLSSALEELPDELLDFAGGDATLNGPYNVKVNS